MGETEVRLGLGRYWTSWSFMGTSDQGLVIGWSGRTHIPAAL